ncbi:MAG: hypothetical protein JWP11_1374 [Frankiales bacterium]|nr:hypothetical protein [Frankiales bacterium]
MRRARAIGLIGAGCAALASAVLVPSLAAADSEAGSGFGSYNLAANAPLEQVRFNDGDKCAGTPGGTGGCEGVLPETVAMLRNGPIGYGLSSVAWPGVLAGNIGSVIIVSQGPPEAKALNDPVRAEAHTGSGPDTVTNTQYPGMTMTATAKDDVVSAGADIAQSNNSQAGNFNNTTSRSKVQLTGPTTAVAEAYSHADDISLAGGVVTIGSVTSTAKGTTDGLKASATGTTLVKDMKIAGVPVTVDEHGVTVNGNNTPLNKTASDAVNTAITNAGMSIAISLPSGKPIGGSIVYNAGSLIFMWKTPGGTATAILGGAVVQLAAVQGGGLNLNLGDVPAFTPPQPAAFTPGTAGTAGSPGTAPVPAVQVPGAAPAVAPPAAVAPALAAQRTPLPSAPSPVAAILGLLGVGLLAAGMKQLPDRVLEARSNACLLGENP